MRPRDTRARADSGTELPVIEHVVRRAAALLRGGMPPQHVWARLGEEESASPQVMIIADAIDMGVPVPEAIARAAAPAWRMVSASWAVAERSGAPLAATLGRIADALRALEQLNARRKVLLAGPRSTVRLVIALPPVTFMLGAVLGFDTWAMARTPLGIALLLAGLLLLLTAGKWTNLLISRVVSRESAAGFALDLTAIHLQSGSAAAQAVREVADCVDAAGAAWIDLTDLGAGGEVHRRLAEAAEIGAPSASLLIAAADAARAARAAELEAATERLATRVLVPLGVCVLPAFISMGALPVMLSMIQGAGLG